MLNYILVSMQTAEAAQGKLLGYAVLGIFCVGLYYYVFVWKPKQDKKKKDKNDD